MSECGTYAGHQRHQRRGEQSCEDCRAARNEYVREFRKRNRTHLDLNSARNKALTALAALYPDEYHRLYVQERLAQRSAK